MLLDVIGAVFDIMSTWYFIRLNTKAWPTGLVATAINAYLYWKQGIYADMLLASFYCFNFTYGWYYWAQPKNPSAFRPLLRLSTAHWIGLTLLFATLFSITYLLLENLTTSNVPILDASTTTLSIFAQWLMYHKIIFAWVLWFITDILYIFLYIYKQLPYYALLMVFYTGMAVVGYWLWRKNKDGNLVGI